MRWEYTVQYDVMKNNYHSFFAFIHRRHPGETPGCKGSISLHTTSELYIGIMIIATEIVECACNTKRNAKKRENS